MIERFEYRGMWWLPQFPKKKTSGTLTFTPERGAILDLDGSLADGGLARRDLEEFDIVLGISLDNKDITLVRCFVVRWSVSLPPRIVPPPQRSSLYVSEVFVGVHFNKLDDIKFKRVSVRYSYLDEWVGVSGFDIEYTDRGVNVKYEQKSPIESWINADYKLSIGFAYEGPTSTFVQKEALFERRLPVMAGRGADLGVFTACREKREPSASSSPLCSQILQPIQQPVQLHLWTLCPSLHKLLCVSSFACHSSPLSSCPLFQFRVLLAENSPPPHGLWCWTVDTHGWS